MTDVLGVCVDKQHFISLEETSVKLQFLDKILIFNKIHNSLAEVNR